MDTERTGFDEYYEATEPGRRERALSWATAIGLQQVDGLTPSDYLIKTAKRNIEGEISGDEARRLVDEYYETRLGHDEPTGHQEADKVSARMNQLIHAPVFGMTPEFFIGLHGKIFEGVFSHAGQIRDVELLKREWVLNGDSVQYEASFLVTPAANAMTNLHRRTATDMDADVVINVGINVGIKTGSTEELAIKAILRNPRITAIELAKVLAVTQRQVERVLATLKKTAGLRRCGARKNGEWHFEETSTGRNGATI